MEPGVIAAIFTGVAIVIAAVIGLWKSSATPGAEVFREDRTDPERQRYTAIETSNHR